MILIYFDTFDVNNFHTVYHYKDLLKANNDYVCIGIYKEMIGRKINFDTS